MCSRRLCRLRPDAPGTERHQDAWVTGYQHPCPRVTLIATPMWAQETDRWQLLEAGTVTREVDTRSSGSPVFAEEGGGNVTLAGILWGGGGGTFVFSPLANIERELGPLQTH
jgi:hypothetical protein